MNDNRPDRLDDFLLAHCSSTRVVKNEMLINVLRNNFRSTFCVCIKISFCICTLATKISAKKIIIIKIWRDIKYRYHTMNKI